MYLISSDKLLLMIEEGPENHVSRLEAVHEKRIKDTDNFRHGRRTIN
jgi:hypothetical protein